MFLSLCFSPVNNIRLDPTYIQGLLELGAVQKLPTYLDVDIFYPKHGQKEAFFDHLTPPHLIMST